MSTAPDDCDEGFVPLSDGGRIAYEIHGREHGGAPLLLNRPLGGTMTLWSRFRARLASELRVISFDRRGTGRSSAAPPWVSTRSLAYECVELLDGLRIAQAHVFGISLGGMVATWLALLAPERVGKLCLASTPERGLELSRAGLRRELGLAGCFARRADDVEPALVQHVLSPRFLREQPREVRRIEQTVRRAPTTRATLLKLACAGLLHDPRRELGQIRCPTLVLAGRDDTLLGTAPSRRLSAAIAGAGFELVERSGHDLTLEEPITSAQRVGSFLRS
jgi:3-oxoadipate enol-lactonase